MNSTLSHLNLKDFTFSYPHSENPVLININLTFKGGESVALVGPSGAGKSTLLNHLKRKTPQSSMIHQEYLLVPQLSVFHNIFMGRLDKNRTIYNLINLIYPLKRERADVLRTARLLDMDKFIDVQCRKLSGGEQQRVAVSRALFRDSSLCFADEPVSAMDPENGERTVFLLTTGRTTIASMHNTELALKYFDRIVALKNGRIHFDLKPSDVDAGELKELYSE